MLRGEKSKRYVYYLIPVVSVVVKFRSDPFKSLVMSVVDTVNFFQKPSVTNGQIKNE